MDAAFTIRFITENNLVGDAIRFVTFSAWSHVEIMTESGTWIGAHDDGGVQERAADYCQPSHERRYAIPCTQTQHEAMMAFARSKIGTPYNFADIAGLFLHRDITTRGAVICSMFVMDVAWVGGLMMLNVLPGFTNLVTPEMLHLSPLLIGRCVLSVGK